MPIIRRRLRLLPIAFLSASVSVYQNVLIMQQASNRQPVHVLFFVFFSFLLLSCDSCHSEVLLSEEKAAAAVRPAVASLGPCGLLSLPLMFMYSTVPQAQSHCLSSTTLHFWVDTTPLPPSLPGPGPPLTPPPHYPPPHTPKTARHQLQGRDSFLLKVTH